MFRWNSPAISARRSALLGNGSVERGGHAAHLRHQHGEALGHQRLLAVAQGEGWVVVHLERIEPTELAELVYEAWRLTAPVRLAAAYGDRPPSLTASKRSD